MYDSNNDDAHHSVPIALSPCYCTRIVCFDWKIGQKSISHIWSGSTRIKVDIFLITCVADFIKIVWYLAPRASLSTILDGPGVSLLRRTIVWRSRSPFSEHLLAIVFALSTINPQIGKSVLLICENGTRVRHSRYIVSTHCMAEKFIYIRLPETSLHPCSCSLSSQVLKGCCVLRQISST